MTTGAVTVAYVHPNDVTYSWHESLMRLLGHDMGAEGRILQGGWISVKCYGADGIPAARNTAVKEFLTSRDADWLLWVDTDMGFGPDALERLLEVADPDERPIVAGLCFAQKHTQADGMGGWRTAIAPTIYDWTTTPSGEQGFLSRATYPVNKVVQCAGTGSAFILIHRGVLEAIAAEHGPVWYDRVPNPSAGGNLIGEDLSFCLRAGALGFPILVHTGVRTTHYKPVWLGEQDFWRQVVAPPATERTAVLVPVMRRPQNAEPFMRSLLASTGMATAYAIAQYGDLETIDAWEQAGATVLISSRSTFAEKANLGYRSTTEHWILTVGDDVRFHPGWLDHAQALGREGFHVVGTNDLGPRSESGQESPHQLFWRDYVDKQGASWDGPGVLCHEGYRHGFVDVETALVAKLRGVWAMAPGAVVEHLHPLFGTGVDDEVYALGASVADQDQARFEARLAEHGGGALDAWKRATSHAS